MSDDEIRALREDAKATAGGYAEQIVALANEALRRGERIKELEWDGALNQAEKRIAALEEALRFYAERSDHEIAIDGGAKARAVLEEK